MNSNFITKSRLKSKLNRSNKMLKWQSKALYYTRFKISLVKRPDSWAATLNSTAPLPSSASWHLPTSRPPPLAGPLRTAAHSR